jgi:hypothetical protein
MGFKRKKTQSHKFKKLRTKKKKKPIYSFLRKEYTINPEIIMNNVWARMGKSLDQRMLHDIYKIIDEFLFEKLAYEKKCTVQGFGSLQLVEEPYIKANGDPEIRIDFIPDLKLKEKIKLLKRR